MFYIFVRACEKYRFTFSLSAYNELILTLRPANTFESMVIKQGYYESNYFILFLRAIKEMKRYRKRGG
jgi:hypothetical protein